MMEETTGGWGRMGGGMLTLQGGLIVFIINNGVFFFSQALLKCCSWTGPKGRGGEGSPRGGGRVGVRGMGAYRRGLRDR